MVWKWKEWNEYLTAVEPSVMDRPGEFNVLKTQSLMEQIQSLTQAEEQFASAIDAIENKFGDDVINEVDFSNEDVLDSLRTLIIDLVYYGELLILHNTRLVTEGSARAFVYYTEIAKRMHVSWTKSRINHDFQRLLIHANALIEAHRALIVTDSVFLDGADALPNDHRHDFLLARDLFSVGLDDTAVLIAGRGLEGILRVVARDKSVTFKLKSQPSLAQDADFHDLIEIMYRLQWRKTGKRLVSAKTRTLLHFIRTHRNYSAHAEVGEREPIGDPREIAKIILGVALRLWQDSKGSRAKLTSTEIEKSW